MPPHYDLFSRVDAEILTKWQWGWGVSLEIHGGPLTVAWVQSAGLLESVGGTGTTCHFVRKP